MLVKREISIDIESVEIAHLTLTPQGFRYAISDRKVESILSERNAYFLLTPQGFRHAISRIDRIAKNFASFVS